MVGLSSASERSANGRLRDALVAIAVLISQAGCNETEKTTSKAGEPERAAVSRTSPSGEAGGIDPCSLVTPGEAEAVLQGKVNGPERASGFGQFSQCQYIASGERISDVGNVTIQLHAVDFPSIRKSYVDGGEKIEPVSGVGEAAFWVPGHSMLLVQKGKLAAGFAVQRAGIDMASASKEVAAKGIARLP